MAAWAFRPQDVAGEPDKERGWRDRACEASMRGDLPAPNAGRASLKGLLLPSSASQPMFRIRNTDRSRSCSHRAPAVVENAFDAEDAQGTERTPGVPNVKTSGLCVSGSKKRKNGLDAEDVEPAVSFSFAAAAALSAVRHAPRQAPGSRATPRASGSNDNVEGLTALSHVEGWSNLSVFSSPGLCVEETEGWMARRGDGASTGSGLAVPAGLR